MDQLFYFSVDGVRCALPLNKVLSILQAVIISPVNNGSPGVLGVINLHGDDIPVYSIRMHFKIPEKPIQISDKLLILKAWDSIIAVVIDDSDIILNNDEPDIFPDYLIPDLSDIPGVIITDDSLVIIIDPEKFLSNFTESKARIADLQHKVRFEFRTRDYLPYSEEKELDKEESILKDRTYRLSLPDKKKEIESLTEVIKFRVMSRELSIELRYIRDVVKISDISPVPGVPEYLAGVFSVRGEILSLVDISKILNFNDDGLYNLNKAIIITDGFLTFGILADSILGIEMIKSDGVNRLYHESGALILPVSTASSKVLDILNVSVLFKDQGMVIDDPVF